MSPKEVLCQMKDLRKKWRNQDFAFTPQQSEEYTQLLKLRRQRVMSFGSLRGNNYES